MWRAQDRRCGICLKEIAQAEVLDVAVANVDHRRPRSHGGGEEAANLQLAHVSCNDQKAASCAGCPGCPREEKLAMWRAQDYRCGACCVMIYPSEALDAAVAVAHFRRLVHVSCINP